MFFSPPLLESGRSPRGKGSFFSSKGKLFPKGKESLCGRKFASFRRAKKFRAHENIFLCVRNLSALPKRSFPHVLCLLFPLRIALRSQGVYLGVLALQRKALQPIGGYCPISRIFAFHNGLVGRIPLSRGEPSNESTTTMLKFDIHKTCTKTAARAGRIETDHGEILTPIFMPVGTVGSVKAVHMPELSDDIHAQIILGNTYHLYLRPGLDTLYKAGGLHKFNSWSGSILTDSGGYQVFSLAHRRKITEEGVTFRSHIDGSKHLFTPERVMDIERIIGADIIMAFDECCPGDADFHYAKKSLALTEDWLRRCVKRVNETDPHYGYHQSLFPIVQGCVYPELRTRAAEFVASLGAEGNAIGGLAVGEPTEKMYEMVELTNSILSKDKPRYLMGVGTPINLLENIARGVDMFDCIMPTRNGRNGQLFTSYGTINIRNAKWAQEFSPIDPEGTSFVDKQYSLAYLHHLIRADEILGLQIASIHNLAFYLRLVREAREHILAGDFSEWKDKMVRQLNNRL